MAPQVGAKGQMTFDRCISFLKNVDIMRSILTPIFCEVAPAGQSILSPRLVTSLFQNPRLPVNAIHASHYWEQVYNWFRWQSRNGSAPNVMRTNKLVA